MAKAGSIVINLSAGTAQFVLDMEKANAKLEDFGRRGKAAGDHAVSSIQATSGALRVLEGSGGIRAAERFLATTLGLGDAFQRLFPLIGAVAVGDVFIKLGTEAFKFFQQIQQGPDKIASGFREINGPLEQVNDELRVSNDRLENEIAKLEHKPENGLKLALDENVVAAEQFANALDKDLQKAQELLTKQGEGGLLRSFAEGFSVVGGYSPADLAKEIADFRKRMAEISARQVLPRGETLGGVNIFSDKAGDRLASSGREQVDRERIAALSAEIQKIQHILSTQLTSPAFSPSGIVALQVALANLRSEYERVSVNSTNGTDKGNLASAQQNAERVRLAKEAEQKRLEAFRESQNNALSALESSETLLASERADFRRAELSQLVTFFDQKSELVQKAESELRSEIGHLDQQSLRDWQAAHDKELKEEERFQEEMSHQKVEWAKRNYEIIAKTYRELSGEKPTEPRPDLPQTQIAGDAATRLKGTAFGNILAVSKAGYASAQEQEAAIEKEKDLLATMQAMNAPLDQQYEVRRKILEMQIQMNGRAEAERDALIQTQVQEELRLGTLKSGTRAFFLEMQEQAEKPGKILYDGLNSALDRVTSQFAKFATGQKTSFGKVFQDLGEQIVESSVKSIAKRGIGALGKALGINIPGLQRQDGQTAPGALWVQLANNSATTPQQNNPTAAAQSIDFGKIFGGSKGGGIFNFLGGLAGQWGGLFGGGGDGGSSGDGLTPDVSSSISYGGAYATGGDINPGSAYLVGENGPEMVVPRGSGTVIPNGKLGGNTYHVAVDARGADENVIYDRVSRAIIAAHNSAVGTSVQASVERAKRTPGGA